MDCSVMHAESLVNPELFRHHLHIDLSVPVPTSVELLPAGSIFCNNDIVPGAPFGKCHFICIPGFENFDRNSYNGCESRNTTSAAATAQYRFDFATPVGTVSIPGLYGGYMIGDYEVEYYMAWLANIVPALSLPIKLPQNIALMNYQLSALALCGPFPTSVPCALWPATPASPNLIPILWY
jgi:hypothetical protein